MSIWADIVFVVAVVFVIKALFFKSLVLPSRTFLLPQRSNKKVFGNEDPFTYWGWISIAGVYIGIYVISKIVIWLRMN